MPRFTSNALGVMGALLVSDAYEKIESSLDRFREAHFYIHEMERFYHQAEPFRWSLNSFLRALKEIPQLFQMELQREKGFPAWYRGHLQGLKDDPLVGYLGRSRDSVVHKGMLVPATSAFIGTTEGRGLKIGVKIPIHPLQDSDAGMRSYIDVLRKRGDLLELLRPDEEALPCVERRWGLEQFEGEVVDVCAKAWLRVGELVANVVEWLGEERPSLALDCRHSSQRTRIKVYDRSVLRQWLLEGEST